VQVGAVVVTDRCDESSLRPRGRAAVGTGGLVDDADRQMVGQAQRGVQTGRAGTDDHDVGHE